MKISGHFAIVRLCKDKTSNEEFALKIIDKSKCKGKVRTNVKYLLLITVVILLFP